LLSGMKVSSQKRTNTRNGQPLTVTSRHVVPKGGGWVVRSEKKGGRFAGMSEDLEKLQPVKIPGYKVRG